MSQAEGRGLPAPASGARPGSAATAAAVVADSTTALPSSITDGLPLFIVPFEVHHGGRVYHDGMDITPTEFYRLQAAEDPLPTTSAPQPGAFLDAFRRASGVSSHIVCLTLASRLSAAHAAAELARQEAATALPGIEITLVDTETAGAAEGLIALEAARLAADGATIDQVMAAVERRIRNVWFAGYLDTLYYVWKGGRMPRVALWLGRMLNVKPVLDLRAGHIGMVARPRGTARAMDRVVALVTEQLAGATPRIAVVHANALDQAQALAERLERELAPREIFVSEFTPVIGAHTGPGLVGCAIHPI